MSLTILLEAHHVIFVVHGMGRQLEVPFGNYEKNGKVIIIIQNEVQSALVPRGFLIFDAPLFSHPLSFSIDL